MAALTESCERFSLLCWTSRLYVVLFGPSTWPLSFYFSFELGVCWPLTFILALTSPHIAILCSFGLLHSIIFPRLLPALHTVTLHSLNCMTGKEWGRAYSKFRNIRLTVSFSPWSSFSSPDRNTQSLLSSNQAFPDYCLCNGQHQCPVLQFWGLNKERRKSRVGRYNNSSRRRKQKRIKEIVPCVQGWGVSAVSPVGPGSCCRLDFKLKWPAKCQTGLATHPPDT